MNQIKSILTRFGIRSFRSTLREAAEQLEGLRTAEGTPLLENTRAELRCHLARLRGARLRRWRREADGRSSTRKTMIVARRKF